MSSIPAKDTKLPKPVVYVAPMWFKPPSMLDSFHQHLQVGNIDLRQGLPVPMDAVAMLEVPENGLRVNLGNTLVET